MPLTPAEIEAKMKELAETDIQPEAPPSDLDFTEGELAEMTPAEREGLTQFLDDDPTEDETAPQVDPDTGTTDAAEPSPPQDQQVAPRTEQSAPEPVNIDLDPRLHAVDEEIAAKTAELGDLRTQWKDAEIDDEAFDERFAEINAEMTRLNAKRGSIEGMSEVVEAQNTAIEDAAKQTADQAWEEASKAFITTHPEFVSDTHFDGFDAEVRAVTSTYPDLPAETQLKMAAERYADVAAMKGLQAPAFAAAAKDPSPDAETDKDGNPIVNPKDAPAPEPPVTLRDVPGETNDPNTGYIAQLAAKLDRATEPDVADEILAQIERIGGEDMVDRVLQYES